MKNIKNISIFAATILTATTLAFAQASTPVTSTPTYEESLKQARATLQADNEQLKTDKAVYAKAIKDKDTTTAATAKTKVAEDKAKVKADTKIIEDMKKAHNKSTAKKVMKKIEKKENKTATSTKAH